MVLSAAQSSVKADAEIAEKNGFRTEAKLNQIALMIEVIL